MKTKKKELTFEEKVLKELKGIRRKLQVLEDESIKIKTGLAILSDFLDVRVGFDININTLHKGWFQLWRLYDKLGIFPFRNWFPNEAEIKKYKLDTIYCIESRDNYVKFCEDKFGKGDDDK